MLISSIALATTNAQQKRNSRGGNNRFAELEKKALAEKFVGVTSDGNVEEGLYSIQSTGVSTKAVKKAADAFLKRLTDDQRKKTKFPVNDNEWRRWANQHSLPRQGVSFEEMSS